mmetsp:Transcript_11639/g.29408  ORF Transcript_11639/g.29408 Transcript_11639/m.29408 type:complete len:587 (+) Transcript_11639:1571-3331(+)
MVGVERQQRARDAGHRVEELKLILVVAPRLGAQVRDDALPQRCGLRVELLLLAAAALLNGERVPDQLVAHHLAALAGVRQKVRHQRARMVAQRLHQLWQIEKVDLGWEGAQHANRVLRHERMCQVVAVQQRKRLRRLHHRPVEQMPQRGHVLGHVLARHQKGQRLRYVDYLGGVIQHHRLENARQLGVGKAAGQLEGQTRANPPGGLHQAGPLRGHVGRAGHTELLLAVKVQSDAIQRVMPGDDAIDLVPDQHQQEAHLIVELARALRVQHRQDAGAILRVARLLLLLRRATCLLISRRASTSPRSRRSSSRRGRRGPMLVGGGAGHAVSIGAQRATELYQGVYVLLHGGPAGARVQRRGRQTRWVVPRRRVVEPGGGRSVDATAEDVLGGDIGQGTGAQQLQAEQQQLEAWSQTQRQTAQVVRIGHRLEQHLYYGAALRRRAVHHRGPVLLQETEENAVWTRARRVTDRRAVHLVRLGLCCFIRLVRVLVLVVVVVVTRTSLVRVLALGDGERRSRTHMVSEQTEALVDSPGPRIAQLGHQMCGQIRTRRQQPPPHKGASHHAILAKEEHWRPANHVQEVLYAGA